MQNSKPFDLPLYLQQCQEKVDSRLEHWLNQQASVSHQLAEAMRYATFNGGKRVRPILVFAAAEALGADPDQAVDAACALEMVHAYSLVHDDLPAMDDDDLRRGKPTCHIAFDEATAILAGDSLQCLAFEVLAESDLPAMTGAIKLSMIRTLAKASGTLGMAGGQALDLAAEGKQLTLEELETMHRHKTGCLIRASVAMGGAIGQGSPAQLQALDLYADAIGLAFQVQDDILDIISDTETLGKQQGADIAMDKATYPNILGLDEALKLAQELNSKAQHALTHFDDTALPLRALANYIVSRSH